MLVCIQRLNAFCNALVTKRVRSNKIKHTHRYLKICHVRVQETHEFRVKVPNHRMLLTGSRLPSSESSVCSGVDSTQISTPGLRKQVQSYVFACLDLTRRFANGPLSLIIQGWLFPKLMVILPRLMLRTSTGCHEPQQRASKAVKPKISRMIHIRILQLLQQNCKTKDSGHLATAQ